MKLRNPYFEKKVEETLEKYPHIEVHIQQIQHQEPDPEYLINVYAKETPETEKYGYLGRSDAYAVVNKKSMLRWRKYFLSRKNVDLYEFQV